MRAPNALKAATLGSVVAIAVMTTSSMRIADMAVPVATMRAVTASPERVLTELDVDARGLAQRYDEGRALGATKTAADSVTSGEVASIADMKSRLEGSAPDYASSRLGFRVYGPQHTAELYAAELQMNSRIEAIGGLSRRLGSANQHTAWGLPLKSTSADKVPTVSAVAQIVEAMKLPDHSLTGVSIFIVPFSLANTSGLSLPDAIVVGSRPADYASIDSQLEFTVAHEVGHILHYRYMGPAGSDAWKEYMRIRRISDWRAGGQALTDDWDASVEESFAEDVRVMLGEPKSAEAEHGTIYGDPRDDTAQERELASFFAARLSPSEAQASRPAVLDVFDGTQDLT